MPAATANSSARCFRRWSGALTFTQRRSQLPGQPVPQLRRVPVRVPVRAAARVRHQRAADARRDPAAVVRGLLLAARPRRVAFRRQQPGARRSRLALAFIAVMLVVGAVVSIPARSDARRARADFYAVVPHGVMVDAVRRRLHVRPGGAGHRPARGSGGKSEETGSDSSDTRSRTRFRSSGFVRCATR